MEAPRIPRITFDMGESGVVSAPQDFEYSPSHPTSFINDTALELVPSETVTHFNKNRIHMVKIACTIQGILSFLDFVLLRTKNFDISCGKIPTTLCIVGRDNHDVILSAQMTEAITRQLSRRL